MGDFSVLPDIDHGICSLVMFVVSFALYDHIYVQLYLLVRHQN